MSGEIHTALAELPYQFTDILAYRSNIEAVKGLVGLAESAQVAR